MARGAKRPAPPASGEAGGEPDWDKKRPSARGKVSRDCARQSGSTVPGTLKLAQRCPAVEPGCASQFFLDAQQLIVLGDAVGARSGTGLDLSGRGRNGQVGDERVL